MIRLLPIALLLASAGCSDMQLEEAAAKHRAYVCSHQTSVTLAANLAIRAAEKIRDDRAREAAIALARAELLLVASCAEVAGL